MSQQKYADQEYTTVVQFFKGSEAVKSLYLVKQVRIPVVFHEFTSDNRTNVNFFTFRWS